LKNKPLQPPVTMTARVFTAAAKELQGTPLAACGQDIRVQAKNPAKSSIGRTNQQTNTL
jgi:hypothetical protein